MEMELRSTKLFTKLLAKKTMLKKLCPKIMRARLFRNCC